MTKKVFIAHAPVICDRCGEMVNAGDAAIAEFYPRKETCKIRHKKCPASAPVGRGPRKPIRPVRTRAARHHKTHN